MLRKFILLIFFILSVVFSQAQTALLQGKIYSKKSKEALPGVTVRNDQGAGTASDMEGNYLLELPEGKHRIVIQLISFRDKTIDIELKAGEKRILNIEMEESATELTPIVVSASKFEQNIEEVTVSMEVLSPRLVEARNAVSMDEAVEQISGVTIIDGQANIRGGSGWSYGAGSRVQILVDDLPQLTADANDTKWSFLPVENLEQIEVIKGASSVLFGSSALNGVINVRTAYPREKPETRITTFTGIYDRANNTLNDTSYRLDWWGNIPPRNGGMNFLHSHQLGNFDLVAGGNMFIDQGYRRGEHEQRARFNANTRYRFEKIKGLSAGVNFNTMLTEGTLFFLWKNDTTGAWLPANNTLSDYTTYRTNIDPFISYVDRKGNVHKLRNRWFGTNNKNNTNQASRADLYYSEYQFQRKFSEFITATGGLVQQYAKVKSELYGDHDSRQLAAYLQGDYSKKRLTVSAGMRAEQNKVDSVSDNWTPVFRTGVNYRLAKSTNVRASVGQGYRFPSIAEKFVRTAVGNIIIYPNTDLEPEDGYSLEFGIRQGMALGSWKGYLDVAIFRNEYQNMMEFGFAQWGTSSDPLLGNGFKSINVGNTRIDGLDLSLMSQGKLFGEIELTLIAGYTYIDPRQLTYDSAYIAKVGVANYQGSDSSDFLKYRSRHLLKADLELTRNTLSLGFSARYNSRMVNIDKIFISGLFDFAFPPGLGLKHYRDHHTGADWILDLRSSWKIREEVQLAFIIKNLFNNVFMQRPADMLPPRIFVTQLSLRF